MWHGCLLFLLYNIAHIAINASHFNKKLWVDPGTLNFKLFPYFEFLKFKVREDIDWRRQPDGLGRAAQGIKKENPQQGEIVPTGGFGELAYRATHGYLSLLPSFIYVIEKLQRVFTRNHVFNE